MVVGFAAALALATLLAHNFHQAVEDQAALLLVRRRRPISEVLVPLSKRLIMKLCTKGVL
jgi:hypothetical protein